MTPQVWLLGFASGLLLMGIVGIGAAATGHVPDWADLYVYLPILITGTAAGWLGGAGLEFELWRQRQLVNTRLDEARAWASELSNQEREAKLNPPAPVEVVEDRGDIERAWRLAFHRFIGAGNRYGFKVRDLGAGPHKVVEWEDWSAFREPLIDMGVLEARGGTRWAEGWGYARWQKEGATIPLPFLKGMPPPVALVDNAAQTQQKQQVSVDTEGVRA